METRLALGYAVVGVTAVLLALISRRTRRLPVSEPLLALVVGVAVGPQVLGLVHPTTGVRDVVLLEGSRVLLAGSVMAAALRFPVADLRRFVRPVLLLLVVAMPVAALIAGGAASLLGLPLAVAAVLGACLSPTDPVLAASVITGGPAEESLPRRLREILTAESGANDGLALPLVGVALAVALPAQSVGGAAPRLVWEVCGGVTIGLLAGFLAGRAVTAASRDGTLGPGPDLVFTVVLAVTVLGLAVLAGTGGVLAVFVAGLAYNRVVRDPERTRQVAVDEALNRFAVLPLFLLLGAVLPWGDWIALGPGAIVFVVALLLVRRLPVVLALAVPARLALADGVFAGWFGPMGVSAVFYLAHGQHAGLDDPRLFAAGTLAVAASVVVFGVTASPGVALYRRAAGSSTPTRRPGTVVTRRTPPPR